MGSFIVMVFSKWGHGNETWESGYGMQCQGSAISHCHHSAKHKIPLHSSKAITCFEAKVVSWVKIERPRRKKSDFS